MQADSGYLDFAEDMAKRAGVVMRKNFTANMKKEWKSDNTPVTETDLVINEFVVKALADAYPGHSILSEEDEDNEHFSRESEYVWICDPVDGTHNFSHGIPTATFALALTRNGQPVISVVYDPFMDRMFSAEKGKGARLNGHPMRVSENPTLKHTMIGMGKMRAVRKFFPVMEELYEYGAHVFAGTSIHFMAALVAAGELSAAFFGGTAAHDITAGTLLVEEAGGKATDIFGGTPERYDRDMEGFLASNGLIHDQLIEIMDKVSPRASG
ncbi:MAG: hypothetical protein KGI41_01580 [Patescibacteria group bacterium]|nr:hypothetical protein [Patescibacteria group bacterium]MDE1965917.1 hypothetical protein [Patescibacteria group bacterium]